MRHSSAITFLAFFGGILLVLMMNCSSIIARYSSPLFSSWIIHLVGTFFAVIIVFLFSKTSLIKTYAIKKNHIKCSFVYYFAGIPGALTVVLGVICVNSNLKLSGTFALMLVGQMIFGIICDFLGLFGVAKKRLSLGDFFVVLSVLMGSGIIILFRS